MTDTPDNAAPAAGAAPQPQQISSRVLAQYIRDMSFENILAQKGVKGDAQPEVQVQVNLDARKRTADHQFEVITKLNITSKTKAAGEPLFVLEIEYAGVFHVEGVPEEQMHPYLLIECPRITFPFLRRIVSDVTRDGGFPALNLETIDFLALYRSELARRAEADKKVVN
ncbi:protein-export chaperone SecB [Yoonia vestfoldensis]|uniref:Protein-export protein SecB n=1 Tax=Yoonia vestfoldensis SKA53 TaxID=314232 RepID=A3V2F7_9RHOB|nr:protein-export chaperone SecB [Yoonia vestfoldensis]EAQ07538.1 Preprotein translocase subunit SecB [Yoonia vestfoldensis SKA53]